MVTIKLSIDDMAQTRFAISPMFELVSSLRALRDPARTALHLPWIREALPIAAELDLGAAMALTPPEGYMPDFLTPPPSSPLATIDDEFELVCGTSEEIIRADVDILIECGQGRRERLQPFFDDPAGEVGKVTDSLREFWDRALADHWPRVRQVLEDDVRYRARRLTEGGPARLFEDLDERVRWCGDRIEVDLTFTDEVDLGGRGLLLVPTAFQATCPAMIHDGPWQPTLIYPSRGVGLLWEPTPPAAEEAILKLIGGSRARLLGALDVPRSTTDLAGMLEMSPGGVSQHLTVLRESGLVCGEREGRSVLYLRTSLADRLLTQPAD